MQPAELHQRVQDGINAGDVEALVALYEPDAVLMAEDGSLAVGTAAIREAFETTVAFGGTIAVQTLYAVECDELALLSNQYTFSLPGFEVTWITAEVARRQADGTWLYVVDNPFAAPGVPQGD